MIKNKILDALDIVVIAGQSNAQGFGVGKVDDPYSQSPEILELVSASAPTYIKDENGKDVFICPESGLFIQEAKEADDIGRKIASLVHTFADNYRNNFLNKSRKILIIKAGVGGTGFAHKQWGVGECLFERLLAMTDEALSMNPQNRVVAFLWHQGECDAFERPELDFDTRRKLHYKNLSSIISHFRKKYGNIPFIAGGFAEEWSSKFREQTDSILSAIRDVCNDFGNARFVEANDLKSNNEDTQNGDDIHFCRSALYTLGRRYFSAYVCIKENFKETIVPKSNVPFDIIVLAGQSNAEGRGVGYVEKPYIPDDDILMLNSRIRPYFADSAMLDFRVPDSDLLIEVAKEEVIRGDLMGCFALTFAKEYKKKHLSRGRKILIVKAAVAGTCFLKGHWGDGNPLSKRLIKMIDVALETNEENRLVAILWHQGESDAMEKPEISTELRYKTHKNNISFLLSALRSRYGVIPFIAGDFVPIWKPELGEKTEVILQAIKDVLSEYSLTGFVTTEGLHSNAEDNGTEDNIHCSRNALYKLGERYFDIFETFINSEKAE